MANTLVERLLHRAGATDDERAAPESDGKLPYEYEPDFDVAAFRAMESEYIRLGHMTEDERMPIPRDVEFPDGDPQVRSDA